MYTIEVENICNCVKKSGMDKVMEFEERQDMINKARVLECRMNQEFCMTHYFEAVDCGDKIVIRSSVREIDEDDEDVDDARDLIRKSPVVIGFDGGATPSGKSGGN